MASVGLFELFLRKRYDTIIDNVYLKGRNPELKKWSLFDIVGTYSCGVNLTLKVGLGPMETTHFVSCHCCIKAP